MTGPSDRELKSPLAEEHLAQLFYANSRYNAITLGIAGLGVAVIFLLTNLNILGEPALQLLYISGTIFLLAILQSIATGLARNGYGIVALFFGSVSVIICCALLTAFWEGILLPALAIALVTPISAVYSGISHRYYSRLALLVVVGIAGIIFANLASGIERLQFDTPASVASLVFLGTVGTLLVTVLFVGRSRRYRSLRSQLLTSFIFIVTVPTLLAVILSAVGAYVNTETQVLNTLQTITILKSNQINQITNGLNTTAGRILQDADFQQNILSLLSVSQGSVEVYQNAALSRLESVQSTEQISYAEIMVLNMQGETMVSTLTDRAGRSYTSELFYQSGSVGPFIGFSKNPAFGNSNLIHATPIYDTDGTTARGILVIRADSSLIKDVVESTPGFDEMESYLIDKNLSPLTKTRTITQTVNTKASELLLANNGITSGTGRYENYAGAIVLGYYQYIEGLDAILTAEVPRSFVVGSSINALLGSTSLTLFAIAIAIVAVMISAESISQPIRSLAKTADDFATGKLSSRAHMDRRDEIGSLGNAYDQMADQLQDIIGRLEQRVNDRTRALEDQTYRLKTSAEIARDAASLHKLDDLLAKAGTLIQQRFGLYHIGLFLLDNNREFAVLASSPTEAGKQMIANNYKVRLGEAGIVEQVALTGEPKILQSTGPETVNFNIPLLPNTRSEMALPLKVENRIIGVLDVQSESSKAFNEDDIAVMQILADQLATAIERTRLLEQVERNLSDLERAYGQFTRASWKSMSESGLLSKTGYRFDNVRIQPISDVPELGDEVMTKGTKVTHTNSMDAAGKSQVAIPIKLRGQTIGVVSATLKEGFTANTISTLELAIERLALSLESARLYEEARLRADREQLIARVTTSISSATEVDTILRTTIEEIGKSLGDSEVSIQIISDADEPGR